MTTQTSAVQHRSTTRVLSVLDLLAQKNKGLSLAEMCRMLEVPKSSLFPIVHTMASKGYLAFNGVDGRYTIGLKTYLAGKAYTQSKDISALLNSCLRELVASCEETSQVGILSDNKVLYIAKADSPHPVRLVSDIGRTLPLYCTAIGKALISELSYEQIEALIGKNYSAYTAHTIQTLDELWKEIQNVKAEGISYDHGEVIEGIECMAAAVHVNGKVKYGLGISVPTYRLKKIKKEKLVRELKKARERLETLLAG